MLETSQIDIRDVSVNFPVLGSEKSLRRKLLSIGVGSTIQQQRGGGHLIVKGLNDVTFKAEKGDRVGLVGHNGAGKSTLLRTIAGIYEPESGTVDVKGKVFPLFNPNLGMDMEESGMVNMFSIGMYLGMSRKDVKRKQDEIIAFSELGDYIHMPVRTYSSGMRIRLSFSIATSIDPDILLLDEDLGIGDSRFTAKVKTRIDELINRSSIMILATHDDAFMKLMCNRSVRFENGSIIDDGDVDGVLSRYHSSYG